MFGSGKKNGDADNYDGGRTASSIVEYARNKLAENMPAPEVAELVDQTAFDSCVGKQVGTSCRLYRHVHTSKCLDLLSDVPAAHQRDQRGGAHQGDRAAQIHGPLLPQAPLWVC